MAVAVAPGRGRRPEPGPARRPGHRGGPGPDEPLLRHLPGAHHVHLQELGRAGVAVPRPVLQGADAGGGAGGAARAQRRPQQGGRRRGAAGAVRPVAASRRQHAPPADGTPVGQNIYMQVLPAGQAPHPTVSTTAAVRTWLDEVDEHDGRLSATPYTYSVPTWHYTMLVWGRTARVGCGFADFNAVGGLNARLVVCNYKEAGNVVGSPAYSVGRPASQCAGAPHAPMTPPPPPPPPVPPPPDAPLPPLPPPPVLDWPAYAGAAADTNMYSATTAPWWQLYPWLPTPAHGEDEARPLLLSRSATTKAAAASTTRARGRRGTEAGNAASTGRTSSSRAVGSRAMFLGAAEYSSAAGTARAAVTRALPAAPLAAPAGSPPGYVYPALCP